MWLIDGSNSPAKFNPGYHLNPFITVVSIGLFLSQFAPFPTMKYVYIG